MITFWNFALFGVVFIISWIFVRRNKSVKTPPGPFPLPILGNALSFGRMPCLTFNKWTKEYGNIYQMYFGNNRTIVLSDLELVKKAFQHPSLQGRSRLEFMESDGPRHGIMLTSGQEWQEQRRFTLRHLRDFGFGKNYMEGLILEEAEELLDWLKSEEGKPVSINRRFNLAVINSLWRITAGVRYSHTDPKLEGIFTQLVLAARSINPVFVMFMPRLAKMFPKLSGFNKIQDMIKDGEHVITEPIKQHRAEFSKELAENPRDFTDAYLAEIERTTDPKSSFYGSFGERSLKDVTLDLFQAGSMTTSTMLTWAVLYLTIFPEAQKKLQEEIDEVVGKSRPPSVADRPKMIYTDALTCEMIRKTSMVSSAAHLATEDITFEGYDVPKGTTIMANLNHIHNNPEVWGDPENFRPERFISPEGKLQKKELLIPFSVGKRVCLGETLARDGIFLFMTSLAQRFEIKPDPDRPMPTLEPNPIFDMVEAKEFFIIVKDRRD